MGRMEDWDMPDLEGRVALVTGASRGIGAAVAHALDGAGVRLGLASRSGDDLGIAGAVAQPCDVRDAASLESGGSTSSSSTPGSGRMGRSSTSARSTSTR